MPARTSTARKPRTAIPMPGSTGSTVPGNVIALQASPLPRRRRRLNWQRLLVVAFTLYTLVTLVRQEAVIWRLRHDINEIKQKTAQLQTENASLTAKKARLESSGYVETTARGQLGLVRPGEIPYTPVPATVPASGGPAR